MNQNHNEPQITNEVSNYLEQFQSKLKDFEQIAKKKEVSAREQAGELIKGLSDKTELLKDKFQKFKQGSQDARNAIEQELIQSSNNLKRQFNEIETRLTEDK